MRKRILYVSITGSGTMERFHSKLGYYGYPVCALYADVMVRSRHRHQTTTAVISFVDVQTAEAARLFGCFQSAVRTMAIRIPIHRVFLCVFVESLGSRLRNKTTYMIDRNITMCLFMGFFLITNG
jgi:hypothetical protein